MEFSTTGRAEAPFLLRAIRHHVALMLGTLLATVTTAGLYFEFVHNRTYTAQSTVLLSPVPGNPLSPESASASGAQLNIAMQTEAAIVNTPQIARTVTDTVGETLPRDGDSLLVVIPTGTQMVQITYTSSTPSQAQQGAQAFADAYLTFRRTRADATQGARLRALEGQLDQWTARLQEATAAAADGDPLARQEVQIASARVAEINASLGTADVISTDPGAVTSPATAPSDSDGLPLWLVLIAASGVGVFLGSLLAALAEWRRDLVRDDELFEIAGLPVLARIEARSFSDVQRAPVVAQLYEPYRRLRAGVVANTARPSVLAVAAVGSEMHTTGVAFNLAFALRQAGFSVLMIGTKADASSSEAQLAPGLAEVLDGSCDLEDAIVESHTVPTLPGGATQAVGDLYAGPRLAALLDSLRASYDYILIGSASTETADGDAAMAIADDVLLAVLSSQTTHAQAAAAIDRLARLDITPLGVVNVRIADDHPSARLDRPRPTGAHGTVRASEDARPRSADPSSKAQAESSGNSTPRREGEELGGRHRS